LRAILSSARLQEPFFFFRRDFVWLTVVLGWRVTVDFFTNRPVMALRDTELLFCFVLVAIAPRFPGYGLSVPSHTHQLNRDVVVPLHAWP
jgi:hypothetical protein